MGGVNGPTRRGFGAKEATAAAAAATAVEEGGGGEEEEGGGIELGGMSNGAAQGVAQRPPEPPRHLGGRSASAGSDSSVTGDDAFLEPREASVDDPIGSVDPI